MADCTKTVDFMREVTRLCNSQEDCFICPFRDEKVANKYCALYAAIDDERAIAIVQKWSDEHPVQTWIGKLRELLPNAPIHEIIHDYCPYQIFGEHAIGNHRSSCADNCTECWNSEYKSD